MFTRHNLVWLNDGGWRQALAAADRHDHVAIQHWRQQDWPTIACRQEVDHTVPPEHFATFADAVSLGLALPPDPDDGTKRRIALRVACAGVKKIMPPLQLAEAIAMAPADWRMPLAALDAEARNQSIPFFIYGSLALQTLTGQHYLTAHSDIDLLFYPTTPEQLTTGLDLLFKHAAILPLDGEIIFPGAQAVAWKEWRNATQSPHQRVLVKEGHRVRLAELASLLETFATSTTLMSVTPVTTLAMLED